MFKTANEMIVSRGLANDLPMMEEYIDTTHPNLSKKRIPFSEYLMYWNKAKENGDLFKLFGDKLIVKKYISYSRSAQEIENNIDFVEFRRLYDSICNLLIRVFSEVADQVYKTDNLAENFNYIEDYMNEYWAHRDRSYINPYNRMSKLLYQSEELHDFYDVISILYTNTYDVHTWYDNKLTWEQDNIRGFFKNPVFTLSGHSKKFRLTFNQKPIRAFTNLIHYLKDFFKEHQSNSIIEILDTLEERIEEMRQFASMLSNDKNTHGNLCVSIHPFDYMTMSERKNGWSSCMEWVEQNGGEYHSGTLEMMTSPCVVVAYLESKETIYPSDISYSWNKKKWRELFIVDKNFISGVKAYPFYNESLQTEVFKILASLAKENWGISYNIKNIAHISDNRWYDTHHFETIFMYNDCDYNSYDMIYSENFAKNASKIPETYYYGMGAYCIVCGNKRDSIETDESREDRINCMDCDTSVRCSDCGRWVDKESCIELSDGSYVCEYCYDGWDECPICGEKMQPGSNKDIYIPMIDSYGNQFMRYIYICSSCYEEWYHKGWVRWNEIKELNDTVLKVLESADIFYGGYKINIPWTKEGPAPDFFAK